ncbi:uncharacterized protein F5147DRAFT_657744 [Suillus discolor]|uniref:CxC1-like cysteine cluster associated with KDZ transposases domain-containing protein n=1 Tax=Suillus discolor TaxID=1912936 RepID=A0A9P7EWA0_9AGAM|nr:uncharacterized protein F5147DRAFT_657744 [Suillus discolor]KAG2092122.1 hypothetical protein F5147DRAFT_657744 [Suillus discolor]
MSSAPSTPGKSPSLPVNSAMKEVPDPTDNFTTDLDDMEMEMFVLETVPDFTPEQPSSRHRISPGKSTDTLYCSWSALIPTLVEPQVQYTAWTQGQPLERVKEVISACATLKCAGKWTTLTCLFFDPATAPQLPKSSSSMVSSPLHPPSLVWQFPLTFYQALFERSCDAINALASALKTYYSRRGFQMMDKQGESIREPFRRGLGYAVQWFDILQIKVEHQLESLIQQCQDCVTQFKEASSVLDTSSSPDAQQHLEQPSSPPILHRKQCSPLLVQRCPACFGGTLYGRPTDDGGDIHVATDGNFHHRHRRSAGDCPWFYDPTYFLPKDFIDEVGRQIESQRKRPPRARKCVVPDEAIDRCENAYEAADGKKQKAAMDSFDDTGIMALICRHDIPLFFANIDSPGEQQKYSVALLQHLFSLLPPQATVVALYDVGCVLARSLLKVDFSVFIRIPILIDVSMKSFPKTLQAASDLPRRQCTHMDMNGPVNWYIIRASALDLGCQMEKEPRDFGHGLFT